MAQSLALPPQLPERLYCVDDNCAAWLREQLLFEPPRRLVQPGLGEIIVEGSPHGVDKVMQVEQIVEAHVRLN